MDEQLILAHVSAHIPLTDAEATFFLSLLHTTTLTRKQFLLHPKEICRFDYFINRGCVKVCYIDEKGAECIVKFAPENWWVTDLDSFLHNEPSFFYIQAIEPTEVLQLSRSGYELLYREIPQFQQFSNKRWQQGFIALQQRIMQNLSMTAEERYHQFTHKYPGLEQRISQKLVAAYLGITPEFLSTLRKKWAAPFS
jgi:CRP-like cAMP-binding protein